MKIIFPKANPEGLGGLKYMEIQRETQEVLIVVSPSTVIFYESYYIKYHTAWSLSLHYDFKTF